MFYCVKSHQKFKILDTFIVPGSRVTSLGFGRGSRVEGTKSRVEGNMSRVEGAKSRVLRK